MSDIAAEDARLLGCDPARIVSQLPKRLSHGILKWAVTHPDAAAVRSGDQLLSHGELQAAVRETATALAQLGIRPGDRVMLVAENGVPLMLVFLALSELDAIAVVINARLSDREIGLIEADCDPRLTIYTFEESPDAGQHGEAVTARVLNLPVGRVLVSPPRNCEPEMVHEDPARQVLAMIYTTGTTGTPKGVMLTHQNLSFVAFVSGKLRGIRQGDEVYGVLPMSHVFGLSAVSASVLFAGGCIHLVARFNAADALRHLSDIATAGFLGVPTMYALMLEAMPENWQPNALRFMYSGGSPLDPDLKRRVENRFGLPLHNGYGLTETGPTICQTRQYAPLASTAVGYCLPGEEIRVLDNSGAPVDRGETGELWVRGPNVMLGYFRKPELTREVLQDGWFNTGDLVFQDETGAVNIAGRSKELIIRSGFNVYPPEVEAVLAAHEDVSLCAVLGETRDGDEDIVAYLQPAAGRTIDLDALKQHARANLSGYKVPNRWMVLDALPTAPSGKILKHRLRDSA